MLSIPRFHRFAPSSLLAAMVIGAASAHASLEWEEPRQSVELPLGAASHEAVYTFTNRGPEPVSIVDLKVDCDCSTAAVAKSTYSAGESGEIHLTLNTRGLEGQVQRELLVKVREGTDPNATPKTIVLQLEAAVSPWLELSPRVLFWPAGQPAKTRSLRIALMSPDAARQSLHLGDIPPDLTVELHRAENGASYTLSAQPHDASGPREWHLPLQLLDEGGSELSTTSVYLLIK